MRWPSGADPCSTTSATSSSSTPFATALIEDKVVAHTAHAEAEIACNRGYAVIGELEALVGEHPYREPLWTQLITAYYLSERQSDALDAYQRLKIDARRRPRHRPGADGARAARADPAPGAAERQEGRPDHRGAQDPRASTCGPPSAPRPPPPHLRDASGRIHPLLAAATRIGRLPDNDIVLDDANVSRHHAVIIDTGTSFVITDLRSANGVDVRGQRIRGTATLADGDRIRICDHEFTFEISQPPQQS